MSEEISKLSVHLSANASGLVGGLKAAETEMSVMGEVAEAVGEEITAMLGPLALVGAAFAALEGLKDIAAEAMENENAFAKLDTVVRATGEAAGFSADELKKMADEMSETTLFTKAQVASAEAVIATFKNIKGEQFEEVLRVAGDVSTLMGGDLKENAHALAKALNDPEEGLKKLRKMGAAYTQEQQDQIKALQEAGKTTEAQAIALKGFASSQGQAEAATNTFSGQMTQLKKAGTELLMQIGQEFVPALKAIVHYVKAVVDWLGKHKDALHALGKAIGFIVGGPAFLLLTHLGNELGSEAKTAGEAMQDMGDDAEEGFEKAHKSAKELKKDLEKVTEHLKEQVLTFGMTAAQAEIYKLKLEGVKDSELVVQKALADRVDQLEASKKEAEELKKAWEEIGKEATKIIEDMRDPFEKLEAQLKHIEELQRWGKLTEEQAALASDKATDEALKAMKKAEKKDKTHEPKPFDKLPPAFETRFTRGFQGNDLGPWEKLLKVEERAAIAAANTERNTKKLADAKATVVKI